MPGLCFLPPFFLFPLYYSLFDPTYNLVEKNVKRLANRGLRVVVFGAPFPPSEWHEILKHMPITSWGVCFFTRTENFKSLTFLRRCCYLISFHSQKLAFHRKISIVLIALYCNEHGDPIEGNKILKYSQSESENSQKEPNFCILRLCLYELCYGKSNVVKGTQIPQKAW